MPNVKNGNGLALLERFIPDGLSHAATAFVESLKINSIAEKRQRDKYVVIKRRNVYGERAADLINFYFHLANLPIRYLSDVGTWRRWEASSFQMLNGDRFRAKVADARTVRLDKLPGQSLWDYMNQGSLTKSMLKAAAREYRRAHKFRSPEFGSPWSHGDASMTNVIYDPESKRARLIDFEITHDKSLPAPARHADDLMVFLLDMVDRVPARQWVPFTTSFITAYGDWNVITELRKRLVVPGGMAQIWWNVRMNFAKAGKVNRRLNDLRRALSKLEVYRSRDLELPRKMRRPSIHCHVTSAGMPTAKSRKRAIKEMAKAV
jgi:hypothetical protein